MGVLPCARRGCDNVMCDRLSHTHGYICDDCYEELVNSGPKTDIDDFMMGDKQVNNVEEAEARYEVVFPRGG